jgi:hypothetical protein
VKGKLQENTEAKPHKNAEDKIIIITIIKR